MPRITITVEGKVPQPYRFGLDRELVTLGRDENNDVLVDCGSVSLHHAVMQRVHGGYELMDKGSTNGIRLDGEYRQVIDLKNGQSVMLGDVVFDFVLTDEELAVLAREDSPSAPAVDPASVLPSLPKEEPPAPVLPKEEPPAPVWPEEEQSAQAWPEEDDEEEANAPGKQVAYHPSVPTLSSWRSHGGLNILICALAAAAFVAGMEIHYRSEMGSSMIGRMHDKLIGKAPQDPVKDAGVEQTSTETN